MSVGGQYSYSQRDWEGDIGTSTFNTGAVTPTSLAGLLTQIGNLRTAIQGLTIGAPASETQSVFDTILGQDDASTPDAQRGNKWLVHYHDSLAFFDAPLNAIPNAGYLKPFEVSLPCADNSLLADNEKFLDITVNPGLAFVTAFEAMARSPYNGTVTVDSIEQVNWNS